MPYLDDLGVVHRAAVDVEELSVAGIAASPPGGPRHESAHAGGGERVVGVESATSDGGRKRETVGAQLYAPETLFDSLACGVGDAGQIDRHDVRHQLGSEHVHDVVLQTASAGAQHARRRPASVVAVTHVRVVNG